MHFLVLLSALVACAADVSFNTTKPAQDGSYVAGTPTKIKHHPHQVAILYYNSLRCGGSIISPTWIVTAAHCVGGVQTGVLTVRAGSTEYASSGTIHKVIGGHSYYSYNPNNGDYNVAVLQVDPPFIYSNSVQNIALDDSETSAGTTVFVTGFGTTTMGQPISPSLLEATVQIIDCRESLFEVVTDRMICAGTPYGGMGSYNGDIGGPLTTLYCPRILVGIASYGPREGGHGAYTTVYTKVSAVREWIIKYSGL